MSDASTTHTGLCSAQLAFLSTSSAIFGCGRSWTRRPFRRCAAGLPAHRMAVGGVAARLSLGRSRGRLPKLPSVARDDAAEPPPDEDPFALLVAEIKLAAALDEPSAIHKAPAEPTELRDALYASRRLNNVLLAQLRDERARRADAELPAAPEKVRPLSASVGLHALRRLSVSSSNLGEGRPRRARAPTEALDGAHCWRAGDALVGDPPHEAAGWYSVYDVDVTTHAVMANLSTALTRLPAHQ